MTNQEAMNKYIIPALQNTWNDKKCKEIIEALEQEPCDTVSLGVFKQVMWERDVAIGQLKELGYGLGEKIEPCDDAINRKDTLKAMIEQLGIRNEDYLIPAEKTLYKVVKNMPPVTPQQKMGRWISIDDAVSECSECGHREPNERFIFEDINFCANCGAKMVVQENEVER